MRKTDRISPKNGYTSVTKNDYRIEIWRTILDTLKESVDVEGLDSKFVFVCMPSSEGTELDVMVSMGIPSGNILAIDDNAALIASAKWRKTYPDIRCYGIKIGNAPARLKKDGLIVIAANLDMCSNLNETLLSEVNSFLSCPRVEESCFAINMMKGRESSALNLLLMKYNDHCPVIDDSRMNAFVSLCKYLEDKRSIVLNQGSYVGNKVPMSWGVFSHLQINKYVKDDVDLFEKIKNRTDRIIEAYNNILSAVARSSVSFERGEKIRRTANEKYKRIDKKLKMMDKKRYNAELDEEVYNRCIHGAYEANRILFVNELNNRRRI